ncbi:hypothetical protein PsorP6_012116 [Peronosclerospora sorghi]|uniref:Uncharacterized protein n=1 Tax=Peronosclerospora sorghi TaxID=230839 RepID=A0ACC0WJS1_9STRA|nr:hypothetical protein PsorP6_012116 [Peronosclerospora sorghi]
MMSVLHSNRIGCFGLIDTKKQFTYKIDDLHSPESNLAPRYQPQRVEGAQYLIQKQRLLRDSTHVDAGHKGSRKLNHMHGLGSRSPLCCLTVQMGRTTAQISETTKSAEIYGYIV